MNRSHLDQQMKWLVASVLSMVLATTTFAQVKPEPIQIYRGTRPGRSGGWPNAMSAVPVVKDVFDKRPQYS